MDIRIAARPLRPGRCCSRPGCAPRRRGTEPQPLLDPGAPRGDETADDVRLVRSLLVDGEWVEVEEAATRLELFDRRELPAISHGICPNCSEMLLAA